MSIGAVVTTIGKALSKLPWKEIGKVSAQLAAAATTVYLDSKKTKLTPTAAPVRGPSSVTKDDNVLKLMQGQDAKIQAIEQAISNLQVYDTEQAEVVADITGQVTTLAGVMQTVSVRVNIVMWLAIAGIAMSIGILIWTVAH